MRVSKEIRLTDGGLVLVVDNGDSLSRRKISTKEFILYCYRLHKE